MLDNNNATLSLDIYTYPLRVPAFQSGTKARGWGTLSGRLTFNLADTERIAAITLSITATVNALIPKSGSADTPAQIDHLNPDTEEANEHNLTLLQIHQTLWQASDDPESGLFHKGSHPFDFHIHLPAYKVVTKGNKQATPLLLPPSSVIDAITAPVLDSRSKSGVVSSLFKAATSKDALPKSWASIKYELGVKVQRVGLFKRSLRLSAPFVYLPPPESGQEDELRERQRLANLMAQIVNSASGDGRQPIEAQAPWRRSPINFTATQNGEPLEGSNSDKGSGLLGSLSSMFSKKPVVLGSEEWSISVPGSTSSAFALRSAIPFILRCQTNKPLVLHQGSPLVVVLYRRVYLRTAAKSKPVAVQQWPIATAQIRLALEKPGTHRINGILVPPVRCVPSFETPLVTLSYFLGVQRSRDGRIVHEQPISLHCLPPPAPPNAPLGPFPAGYTLLPPSAGPVPTRAEPPAPSQRSVSMASTSTRPRASAGRHEDPSTAGPVLGQRRQSSATGNSSSRANGGNATLSPSTGSGSGRRGSHSASPSARNSSARPNLELPPAQLPGSSSSHRGQGGARKERSRERRKSALPALPPKETPATSAAGAAKAASRRRHSHANLPVSTPLHTSAPASAQAQARVQALGVDAPAIPSKPASTARDGGPSRTRYSSWGALPDPHTSAALSSTSTTPSDGNDRRRHHTHAHNDDKRAMATVQHNASEAEREKEKERHTSPSSSGKRDVGEYRRVGASTRREPCVTFPLPQHVAAAVDTATLSDPPAPPATIVQADPAPLPPLPHTAGFIEQDLHVTYGEDMDLDLLPSYFEATAEDNEYEL
ncbi:hypothetical protein ACQY0O_001908 [Thecaphora frezii]